MIRKTLIVDVDHTLSAAWPRDHLIGNVSWNEYHEGFPQDVPISDMVNLINSLHNEDWYICAITARPEKWRALTIRWFIHYNILIDELLMRPSEGFQPAPEIKVKLALERFPDIKNQVALILEDREDVIKAFMALGITCLQVYGRRD